MEYPKKLLKITVFQIGLLATITGILVAAYLFTDTQKINQDIVLDTSQIISLEKNFQIMHNQQDIGFFKVYTPQFQNNIIFVQILDISQNVIADKKIQTKMAINYFDIDKTGLYTIKVTNLSQEPIYIEIEFGQTNSNQLIYPGIIIIVGVVTMIGSAYKKLNKISSRVD